MAFQAQPRRRLPRPAGCPDDAWRRCDAGVGDECAAEREELALQVIVEFPTRNSATGCLHFCEPSCRVAPGGALQARRIVQTIGDSKSSQRFPTHAADEFSTYTVPGIRRCFVQSHRHSTRLQGDAQRQPSKSASRYGDWVFQRREATSLNAPRQWDDSSMCYFFEFRPGRGVSSPWLKQVLILAGMSWRVGDAEA